MTTSVSDAQINAVTRLIEVHGRLPTVEEIRERGKDDPRFLGPDALFRYERALEPPVMDEGFTAIEERNFTREPMPNAPARAMAFDFDELMKSDTAAERLAKLSADGWLLFAHAWRPEIARGQSPLEAVAGEFARARDVLGVEIDLAVCPHDAGPPICWCRKPLPGSVLEFAIRRNVDLTRSVLVGSSASDRTMAARLAMSHQPSI